MKNKLYRNKLTAFCMLAILALGQFALANHSAVHYDHIIHEGVVHEGDAPNSGSKYVKHNCPECLLTHAFNIADISTSFYYPRILFIKQELIPETYALQDRVLISYEATGPPAISI